MAIAHPEHAAINLPRLVDSLKARIGGLEKESWVEVRGGRQTVRYARELLEHVESAKSLPEQQLKDLVVEIESLERSYDAAVDSHPIPSSSKASPPDPAQEERPPPQSVSAHLPQPPSKALPSTSTTFQPARSFSGPSRLPTPLASAAAPPVNSDDVYDDGEDDLLPLVPKTARDELLSGAGGKEKGLGFMGTSQLHDELSGQLAQMSRQLKDNAIYFSKSLEDEKVLLEGAGTVLEGNLEKTRSSKAKLSAVSKKSRGTTWLTLLSVGIVLFGFSWTMLLIRFS